VVVVGGGLAGITAALLLAEAGLPVTVIEARPWLGGATWSFGRRGLTIDNGQHVFMRCFTAYRDLLAKLGVSELAPVQDRLDFSVATADGPLRLRRSAWPAPTHLAPILARYRPLTASQRFGVLPAAMGMWLSDLSAPANADVSVGGWLGRHGQDERAVSLFWELFLAPFMNASAADTDLGTAAGFINVALLSRRDHADLGVPAAPLRELHAAPAARRLAELGAEVRLGAQVTAVRRTANGGYVVQLDAGKTPPGEVPGQLALGDEAARAIDAAGVVLAVPAWSAAAICPEELAGHQASWGALAPAPVVSVHVIYETQVTRLPYALATGSPLRWIADKTGPAGLHTGQYLAASIPAARQFVDQSPAAIRAMALPALEQMFPAAARARVEDFFVTRERRATFLPSPGSRSLRPDQETSLPGLAIAGAWTDTGWPDTMEGAVRSGHRAAEAVLRVLARAGAAASAVPSAVGAEAPGRDRPDDSADAVPVAGQAAPATGADVPAPAVEVPSAAVEVPAPAVEVPAPGADVPLPVVVGSALTDPVAVPVAAATAEDSAAPVPAESPDFPSAVPAGPVVDAVLIESRAADEAPGDAEPGRVGPEPESDVPDPETAAADPAAAVPEPVTAVPELKVVPSPPEAAGGKVPAQRGRRQSRQAARQSGSGVADGRGKPAARS
jgi:squalene-associated FAD-dependent desaturase